MGLFRRQQRLSSLQEEVARRHRPRCLRRPYIMSHSLAQQRRVGRLRRPPPLEEFRHPQQGVLLPEVLQVV